MNPPTAETLLDLLYENQRQENNPELKYLIFTEFVPTQKMLREFLEQHGEGVHHIACMGTGANYEENLENFEKMGLEPLMSGAIGDTIKFYYLDSEPLLKIVLESGSGHMISIKPAFTYP